MTDKTAREIAAIYAKRCGLDLDIHQWVMVEHVKNGRQHFHVVVNRVNPLTFKCIDPGLFKKKGLDVAREVAIKFGLKSAFDANDREKQNAARLGRAMTDIDKAIYQAFKKAKTGHEFTGLLNKEGLTLMRGRLNRKGMPMLLAVDKNGGAYKVMSSLRRGDYRFQEWQLIKKLGAGRNDLPAFDPRAFSQQGHEWAGLLGETPTPRRKKGGGEGKSDGSGGGVGSMLSMFRFSARSFMSRHGHEISDGKPTGGGGGERRRRNKWVPVERRTRHKRNNPPPVPPDNQPKMN